VRNINKCALLVIASLMALPTPVAAGPLEDAKAANARNDYSTALRLLRPMADQGNAEAQTSLGLMYESGEGVPLDYVEAVKWFRRAAEQGNVFGQYSMGRMYTSGEGTAKDLSEAAKWFRKAAEQGSSLSQLNLGVQYENGW
jgi:TPR repeat protein